MMMYTLIQSWLVSKTEGERGAGLAEYALLLFLVALAALVALTALGARVSVLFTEITTALGG